MTRFEAMPSHTSSATRIADIKPLVALGRDTPRAVFADLRRLAASEEWQAREVAATALVEIAKRQPAAVSREAARWAVHRDPRVRRAASEGLRGMVKNDPRSVRPILEKLRADPDRYVQKSVANVLRNASIRHPEFVLEVCRAWARSRNPNTCWIVRDGLRKLKSLGHRGAAEIVAALKD